MKRTLALRLRGFGVEFGWFPGNPLGLFMLELLMAEAGLFVVLGLQVAKFSLTIYFDNYS